LYAIISCHIVWLAWTLLIFAKICVLYVPSYKLKDNYIFVVMTPLKPQNNKCIYRYSEKKATPKARIINTYYKIPVNATIAINN